MIDHDAVVAGGWLHLLWAVAAAVARMMGEPVPPYMYPDHVTITMDNIDQYYPQ